MAEIVLSFFPVKNEIFAFYFCLAELIYLCKKKLDIVGDILLYSFYLIYAEAHLLSFRIG